MRSKLITTLIWSLTAMFMALWLGGNAWHDLTCCQHHHCRHDSPNPGEADHCSHTAPIASHSDREEAAEMITPEGGEHSPTPMNPLRDHDSDDCPVCQWYSLISAPVSFAIDLETSDALVVVLQTFRMSVTAECVIGQCQPRAPPAIS